MSNIVYFLFSKFSPVCNQVFPTMKGLAQYINVLPINIDHPQVRSKILTSKVKTVPAVIVQSPSSLEIYEGDDFVDFLNKVTDYVKSKSAISTNGETVIAQGPSQVQSIVSPMQAQQTITEPPVASISSRLQPLEITTPAPPNPMVTTQVSAPSITAQAAVLQQQHQQQPMQPQQTMMTPQPQQTQQQAPPQMMGEIIDASVIEQPPQQQGGSTLNSTGHLTMQEITGTQSMSRMDTGGAKATADAMQREREEAERSINPRSAAQALQSAMQNGNINS
jgi:hypothetical protein